jgi:serine/threonine-protein kinase
MADIGSLGKYELRREIGRGAMGVVYEGYDPMIKRVVALKTIRADQLAGEESATVIARFRREAQAAGRLSHPNIVPIYDFGEDGGVWYIAMECVHGRELKDYFEANQRFAMADIVRIMTQMLDALDYSHRQGVIHRDIKPANVFLLDDGTVKVADFGIAHIDSSSLTQVGTVLGTPSYMSPEQIQGLPVDGRSDIFSAGVILYQFLTGERPFAGSATTTMQKVLKEEPLPPSTLNVQVMPGMDAVVRKALAKRADDRYQSAREFAAALRAAAPAQPVRAVVDPSLNTAADATVIAAPNAAATMLSAPSGAATPVANPNPATAYTNAHASMPPSPSTSGPAQSTAALPGGAATTSPPSSRPASRAPLYAVVAILALVIVGGGAWWIMQRTGAEAGRIAASAPGAAAPPAGTAASTSGAAAPAPPAGASSPPPPLPAPAARAPGTVLISAVGLVDPSDPRYQGDKTQMQNDLRADSRSQAVQKALGLIVEPQSLARNYDWLRDKLLSHSGDFVTTVVRESEPHADKDGLVSMTTQAVVDVKAVQKSLNQMSRDERVDLIRASGDPRVSVRITVRDADAPGDAPAQGSPVAENIVKERIKGFGFRTWSDTPGAAPAGSGPDFDVIGEAKIRKLSVRLEASGVVVSKYALTSWTVRCVDHATGEEIYFNTTLPKGAGSWPTEEEAIRAIGTRVAEEFSRDFFLQHVASGGTKVVIAVDGMPATANEFFVRELIGLPGVLSVAPSTSATNAWELQLAGSGPAVDRLQSGVLGPLNAKLGQSCFAVGATTPDQVSIAFDKRCTDAAVLQRFETYPPASLYGAPPARQKSVIKNPDTLRKLTT